MMSRQQTYLLHVLREVERYGHRPMNPATRTTLDTVIDKVSHSRDVYSTVESLYAVQGCEVFALQLLWCLERNGIVSEMNEALMVAEDAARLSTMLPQPSSNPVLHSVLPPASTTNFHVRLHAFGKAVEELRRQTEGGNSPVDEYLYRIANVLEDLREASSVAGKLEITDCAKSLLAFVRYVVDGRLYDHRVVRILAHANLALQTAEHSALSEGYDPVTEIASMLKKPELVLGR
jgi:hypothetical protein